MKLSMVRVVTRFRRVLFVALATLIRLLSRVRARVDFEIALGRKPLAAPRAGKWLFARMRTDVALERVLLPERSRAVRAAIRSLVGVGANVPVLEHNADPFDTYTRHWHSTAAC